MTSRLGIKVELLIGWREWMAVKPFDGCRGVDTHARPAARFIIECK